MFEMMQKQLLDNLEHRKIMYQIRRDPRIRRHTITSYSVHLPDLIQLWTASGTTVYKAQTSATGACWNSVLLDSHHHPLRYPHFNSFVSPPRIAVSLW